MRYDDDDNDTDYGVEPDQSGVEWHRQLEAQHRDDPEFLKMDEMADLDDLRRQEELDEDQ